jgi:hypothetical protein
MKSKSKSLEEREQAAFASATKAEKPRRVSVRVLCEAGWIAGDLHVPQLIRIADYLNRNRDFLNLSGAFTEGQDAEMPFLALQHRAIYFIVCNYDEEALSAEEYGVMECREVDCLTAAGTISGLVAVKPGVRISERLANRRAFLAVTNCLYQVRDPYSRETFEEKRPCVFLNTDKIIGIAEAESPD